MNFSSRGLKIRHIRPEQYVDKVSQKSQYNRFHALSWLETDLLEVFLIRANVLELAREWAQLTTTTRCTQV